MIMILTITGKWKSTLPFPSINYPTKWPRQFIFQLLNLNWKYIMKFSVIQDWLELTTRKSQTPQHRLSTVHKYTLTQRISIKAMDNILVQINWKQPNKDWVKEWKVKALSKFKAIKWLMSNPQWCVLFLMGIYI